MKTVKDKKGLTIEIKISWSIEDILGQEQDETLTRKEASEVLNRLAYGHDCCIGINWDVIDIYIQEVINERNNNVENKKSTKEIRRPIKKTGKK